MKANLYLYIILTAVLFSLVLGWATYNKHERTLRLRQSNVEEADRVAKLAREVEAKKAQVEALAYKRRGLQTQARNLARRHFNTRQERVGISRLDAWFKHSLMIQDLRNRIYVANNASVQDTLQEHISIVERGLAETEKAFAKDAQRLQTKSQDLLSSDKTDNTKFDAEKSKLENELDRLKQRLRRKHNLAPMTVGEPQPVARVLDYFPGNNRVIISLGQSAGAKKNLRFSVFQLDQGGGRREKGFLTILEVHELTSVGVMEEQRRDLDLPIRGDGIGNPLFRQGGINFYLHGQFKNKYPKDKIVQILEYMGNRVLPELTEAVDIMIIGQNADPKLPIATSLGIRVIEEDRIAPFLGY